MKFIARTAMIAAALSTAPASAQTMDRDADAFCAKMGELAFAIMEARQSGVAMSKLMLSTSESGDEDPDIKGVVRSMIRLAYQEPRESNEQDRFNVTVEFQETFEKICYQED